MSQDLNPALPWLDALHWDRDGLIPAIAQDRESGRVLMFAYMAFGVTFEVPVIVIVLVRIGLVSVAKLKEWRPYVIVGAFVVGAIFTPPDVLSQLMLAVPLWLLFELGLLLARFFAQPPAATSAQEGQEGDWQALNAAEMEAAQAELRERQAGKDE